MEGPHCGMWGDIETWRDLIVECGETERRGGMSLWNVGRHRDVEGPHCGMWGDRETWRDVIVECGET